MPFPVDHRFDEDLFLLQKKSIQPSPLSTTQNHHQNPKPYSVISSIQQFRFSVMMAMELELEAAAGGGRGSRVVSLSGDAPAADLGRGYPERDDGPSKDRTVSRRHVSLRLLDGGVAFEVVGRNPVVVRRSSDEGGASGVEVFRRGEKGELRPGDALSLSLKAPAFWAVRGRGGNREGEVEAAVLDAVARRERRTRERKEREKLAAEEAMEMEVAKGEEEGRAGSDVEGLEIDLASIDPVKEFGFLSMGHEFDSYPKGRIRPPKDWNWFLEEIKRNSDDEEDEVSSRQGRPKGRGGSKKKDGEGVDEDWTDEGEDQKEAVSRGSGVKRTKYETRSRETKKPRKENSKVKGGNGNNNSGGDDDVEEEEDDEDETLGGFIVNEEDEAMDELNDEEEEEDEFDDEDEDD